MIAALSKFHAFSSKHLQIPFTSGQNSVLLCHSYHVVTTQAAWRALNLSIILLPGVALVHPRLLWELHDHLQLRLIVGHRSDGRRRRRGDRWRHGRNDCWRWWLKCFFLLLWRRVCYNVVVVYDHNAETQKLEDEYDSNRTHLSLNDPVQTC